MLGLVDAVVATLSQPEVLAPMLGGTLTVVLAFGLHFGRVGSWLAPTNKANASSEMLETAHRKLARRGLASRIRLAHGLAEDLDTERLFGVSGFDAVFFSYSLSMIPECTRSLDAALRALKAGGSLCIVDFCDQAAFHPALQKPLKAWLGLFGVAHRQELHQHLSALAEAGLGTLRSEPFAARYGMHIEFTKT